MPAQTLTPCQQDTTPLTPDLPPVLPGEAPPPPPPGAPPTEGEKPPAKGVELNSGGGAEKDVGKSSLSGSPAVSEKNQLSAAESKAPGTPAATSHASAQPVPPAVISGPHPPAANTGQPMSGSQPGTPASPAVTPATGQTTTPVREKKKAKRSLFSPQQQVST